MNKILKCKICGFEANSLLKHISCRHLMSVQKYREIYNEKILHTRSDESIRKSSEAYKKLCKTPEYIKKLSDSIKKYYENPDARKKNSDAQKNGGSCLTKKYWLNKGFSEEESKIKVSELQKQNSKKHIEKNNLREGSCFCIEYWLKRGFSDEESKKKISELQSKLSAKSSKFLGCIRTDDQKERISSSLKIMINKVGRGKWAKHFGEFNGRSKAEIGFYNFIKENIDNSVEANVSIGDYIVDIIKDKKIIEFYGDFWHANPNIFDKDKMLKDHRGGVRPVKDIWENDEIRIGILKNLGYDVLVIWESDWNKNKEKCIEEIKKYII